MGLFTALVSCDLIDDPFIALISGWLRTVTKCDLIDYLLILSWLRNLMKCDLNGDPFLALISSWFVVANCHMWPNWWPVFFALISGWLRTVTCNLIDDPVFFALISGWLRTVTMMRRSWCGCCRSRDVRTWWRRIWSRSSRTWSTPTPDSHSSRTLQNSTPDTSTLWVLYPNTTACAYSELTWILTGSFTKPWAHGFVAGYFLQPITLHDTEVLKNLIG